MAEIVVAHESEAIREAIARLCADAGYAVRAVGEGRAALAAIDAAPAALVLDVALPGVHAYEIVEESKRRAPATRIVLVASIYNRTGYKRRPTS
ncbi:MAG TPA: response regulator, partial [Polyangia bacterium]